MHAAIMQSIDGTGSLPELRGACPRCSGHVRSLVQCSQTLSFCWPVASV